MELVKTMCSYLISVCGTEYFIFICESGILDFVHRQYFNKITTFKEVGPSTVFG